MSKEIDPETDRVLTEGEALSNLVKGDGWQIARRMLYEDMNSVASVMNMEPQPDATKALVELEARKIAIETIQGWFKNIDQEIANYKEHADGLIEKSDSEEIIQHHMTQEEDGT